MRVFQHFHCVASPDGIQLYSFQVVALVQHFVIYEVCVLVLLAEHQSSLYVR